MYPSTHISILRSYVGSALDQQTRDVDMTTLASLVQRRRVIVSRCLDVGSAFDQQTHDVDVTINGCCVQWRLAIDSRCLQVGSALDQQTHDVAITTTDGHMQRRPPVLFVVAIDISAVANG
eukprot:m.106333 g.106333  ORF g.106333 m.106333 type:complete len:121 (+) comp15149_c0_seq1:1237-1599(+)